MKKVSTAATKPSRNLSQSNLTIGLEGDYAQNLSGSMSEVAIFHQLQKVEA